MMKGNKFGPHQAFMCKPHPNLAVLVEKDRPQSHWGYLVLSTDKPLWDIHCFFSSVDSFLDKLIHFHILMYLLWNLGMYVVFSLIKKTRNKILTEPSHSEHASLINKKKRVGYNTMWTDLCRQKGEPAVRTDFRELLQSLGTWLLTAATANTSKGASFH